MSGPAANGNTFDLVPPRRPSVVDCGDVVMVDDLKNPPIPGQMPTAAQFNATAGLLAAICAVMPHTVLSMHITAGVPGIFQCTSASSAVQAAPSSLLLLTDNGPGDTSVTWPAGTFPPAVALPTVSINTAASYAAPIITAIANGFRVQTVNLSSAGTDADWTAEIR